LRIYTRDLRGIKTRCIIKCGATVFDLVHAALALIGDRLHMMVFTPRANKAHVISLRKANKREVKRYEAQV
jgi:hypothetical protein